MPQLILGLAMLVVGGLLVTVGGYLANDGWNSLNEGTSETAGKPTSNEVAKLQITVDPQVATPTSIQITDGIDSFGETATDFVAAIERNIDAFYRIEDRIKARSQLARIESILSLFPQIWFFNGMFASDFLAGESTTWVDTRDKETLDAFTKVLDDAELAFSENAPRVSELGSDITLLFRQQMKFRRQLIELAEAGHTFSDDDVRMIRQKLNALRPVEDRFRQLSMKYRNDSIREFAAEHPDLGAEEIAEKLDLWPPRVVETALERE